jgi:N-acyl-D-amino-acid deacylase
MYAPAPYAKTEEIDCAGFGSLEVRRNLCDPHAQRGRRVLEAIDEAVRIGREAHVPVEIWHFKVAGKANWGHMPESIARVNRARAEGIDVTADTLCLHCMVQQHVGLRSGVGA